MTLRSAASAYVSANEDSLAPTTMSFIRGCLAPVLVAMGDRDIAEIDVTSIMAYRNGRKVRAVSLNQEMGVLRRALAHAGLPRALDGLKPLRCRPARMTVLDPADKRRLFETAATDSAWRNAYRAAVLSACTTMRSCEIKSLQWLDVDYSRDVISVPVSKSTAGCRAIPINATLREALGTPGAPDHYVVYSIRDRRERPTEPAKTWKRAWASLCRAAGLPGLHFHALRHQAITEMLENGAPDEVVRSVAGHVSRRMMEHYSHVRVAAKAAAVAGLECT